MKWIHVENWARCGGIGTYSRDLALTFPEFQHEILFLNKKTMQYDYVKWFNEHNIQTSFSPTGKLSESMVRDTDILMLHNFSHNSLDGSPEWLGNYRVFNVHHAFTDLFYPFVELDLFVSYWLRNRFYEKECFMRDSLVVPPCVWSEPYLGITFRGKVPPVVGRIQSRTFQKDKFKKCTEILNKVQNCNFFIVGGTKDTDDKRFSFAKIKPGMMSEYLKGIDIFVLDCPTRESWSRVATEAMLAGKVVIARNYGDGLAEQMHKAEAPLANSEEEYIHMIQAFVDNPGLCKAVGEKLRLWAYNNVSEKVLRRDLINVVLKGM